MKKQNTQLKSARLAKSWTPGFISKQLGVSVHTYLRWETGVQVPRSHSMQALCKIFSSSPQELGFVDDYRTSLSSHPLHSNTSTTTRTDDEPIPPTILNTWAHDIANCWQLYMAGNQHELEERLPDYLTALTRTALTPGTEQHVAAGLTTQLYQLMALLELQRGDFVTAQAHATQALVFSQLAKDWNLYIATQVHLASIFSMRKRVGSALSAYNDALKRITMREEEISPLLHSWIFAGLAEIQATMGREQEALQFLQLAFTVFPDEPTKDPCFSYTHYDRFILYLYEGLVFLRLGQPKLAWEAFAQVDELHPPQRVRAEFLKQKTYTSLVLGTMIQCCIYMEAAVKAAQEINSDLLFSEMYGLYEHMLALWGHEVRVRELARLFQQ